MTTTEAGPNETNEGDIMNATASALWSVQDVATYLGVPVMTVYHWRRIDYGPKGTRVGRYVRYRPEDVRAWFDEQYRTAG